MNPGVFDARAALWCLDKDVARPVDVIGNVDARLDKLVFVSEEVVFEMLDRLLLVVADL